MQIAHIILRNFGKFDNFACDFRPGLNLIKGPNEAGKSTLANAITAALFLNPADGKKELGPSANWEKGSLPALEAILNIDNQPYKLTKDFEQGTVELANQVIGITKNTPESVDDWLSEQLGISSEEIFRATACIGQGDIAHIEDSFEAIKDKLESLVTGGREEKAASLTIEKIERRILLLAGEDGETAGELGSLNGAADEINYNIEKLAREIASLKSKRADLIQVEMAYKNVREDLQTKKEKSERSRKANKLEDNYLKVSHELRELESKLGEAQESLKKIKGLRDRQTNLKSVDQKDLGELDSVASELNYMMPKRRELESDSKEAREEFEAYKIGGVFIGCIAAGFLGAIAFSLSFFLGMIPFLRPVDGYGAVISLGIMGLGVGMTVVRNQHKNYLKDRTEKLEGKLSELDMGLQRGQALLKSLLAKYSSISVEELKRSIWQYDDVEKQVAREKELYESILEGQSLQELERRQQLLQDALDVINKDKKELAQYIIDEEELSRQFQVISQFEERLKDLERERTVLRQQLETAEGGAELLASYTERREAFRSRAEKLLRQLAILRLTANSINEARQNVLVSTLEVLNVRTSDILNKLTSGRYSRVRFDKSTMKFEVFSDQKGEWLYPEKGLSSGTVDQIYLAARLALAELVSEERNSVMILDDPFANYDEKRLENAMRVIKELSENHQILLLTSQDHYDKWADCTISL